MTTEVHIDCIFHPDDVACVRIYAHKGEDQFTVVVYSHGTVVGRNTRTHELISQSDLVETLLVSLDARHGSAHREVVAEVLSYFL